MEEQQDTRVETVETVEQEQPQQSEITTEALEEVLREAGDDHPLKKWLQSREDKRVSQALKTWKENNLSNVVEEEIAKRFPDETEEQKELRQLREELAAARAKNERAEVERELAAQLKEKELPEELAALVAGPDKEEAEKRFDVLAAVLEKWKEYLLGIKRQQQGKPPAATGSTRSGDNPFKTNNLTEITRLLKEDPVTAKQLAEEAGKGRMFQHMTNR
ncbi:capsid assembly scaffolding protein Gp46 family protein [Desmospora activa]|uniref:Uncharacterized protein DUF4355 n=1 Tax=Desmospora activa DSM 45169 TaxID=1121389 RepID=A0A2T4Z910_9BACL|nr:DUF4355 domain-containing protein [Desmospora activa]PTM58374.1 uncharacterized protein DUF4355 [Desmospora activa DSM 45169]